MRLDKRTLAALCLALAATRVHALTTETIVSGLANATRPVLAIDPTTGAPHSVFVDNDTLYHAWRSGDAWQLEPVASGVIGGQFVNGAEADLKIAPDGRVYVLYHSSQNAGPVFAERTPGGWNATTLDGVPAQGFAYGSLAVSPVTGEPVVAWARRPEGALALDVKVARRSAGTWTTQVLDTTSAPFRMVAVAVDAADRPRVAWGRWRADNALAIVLTCALASGPTGPYAAAPVDSELATVQNSILSLAVDPVSGEPRIAYTGSSTAGQLSVRYAALAAGSWQVMTLETRGSSNFPPPALAIDPAGDPYLATTEYTPIGPEQVRGGDGSATESCVIVQTGQVILWHRAGGAGLAPFTEFAFLHDPGHTDNANGPRALASAASGTVAAAIRSPGQTCAPYAQSYALTTPFAGVEPGPGARVALGPVEPNPARVGAELRAPYALAHAADVSLELLDVAGRRVATRALGAVGAGPHTLAWAPSAPRAGVYWLTLRADGARLGTRAVVLAR